MSAPTTLPVRSGLATLADRLRVEGKDEHVAGKHAPALGCASPPSSFLLQTNQRSGLDRNARSSVAHQRDPVQPVAVAVARPAGLADAEPVLSDWNLGVSKIFR